MVEMNARQKRGFGTLDLFLPGKIKVEKTVDVGFPE
jgi:hypothetical protein